MMQATKQPRLPSDSCQCWLAGLQVTRDNRPNKSPTDIAIQCGERAATGVVREDDATPTDVTTLIMGTTDRSSRHPPQCEDTGFYRRIMQERYPEVIIYHCDVK